MCIRDRSYVDKESEVRVVKALTALLPEAGFITEEGSATYQDEPYLSLIHIFRSFQ